MNTSKLTWKVVRVSGDLLEKTLNDLSAAEIEVFAVQMVPGSTGEQWAIVARSEVKEEVKGSIGFSAKKS